MTRKWRRYVISCIAGLLGIGTFAIQPFAQNSTRAPWLCGPFSVYKVVKRGNKPVYEIIDPSDGYVLFQRKKNPVAATDRKTGHFFVPDVDSGGVRVFDKSNHEIAFLGLGRTVRPMIWNMPYFVVDYPQLDSPGPPKVWLNAWQKRDVVLFNIRTLQTEAIGTCASLGLPIIMTKSNIYSLKLDNARHWWLGNSEPVFSLCVYSLGKRKITYSHRISVIRKANYVAEQITLWNGPVELQCESDKGHIILYDIDGHRIALLTCPEMTLQEAKYSNYDQSLRISNEHWKEIGG